MSFSLRERLCSSGRSPSSELGQARRRLLPLRFFFIVTPFTGWPSPSGGVCVCVGGATGRKVGRREALLGEGEGGREGAEEGRGSGSRNRGRKGEGEGRGGKGEVDPTSRLSASPASARASR